MHPATLMAKFWWLAQTNDQSVDEALESTERLFREITTTKLAQAIIVLGLAYGAISLIDRIIDWLSERVPRQLRLTVKQSLPFWRALILGFTLVTLINLFLKLSSSNVLAITGTVAVALGFAFKDYASSVIAGLIALFETPYQVGDRIAIAGHYGEVISYGLRGIRLQTPDDNTVTVPHNILWTEAVSNANKGKLEAQVVTDFYCAHESDPEVVIHLLYRVAQTSKYTQLKLPITVIMEEHPWGTHFKLKAYPMDARDEFEYKTDLLKRAKKAFHRHEIRYPTLRAFSSAPDSSLGV